MIFLSKQNENQSRPKSPQSDYEKENAYRQNVTLDVDQSEGMSNGEGQELSSDEYDSDVSSPFLSISLLADMFCKYN